MTCYAWLFSLIDGDMRINITLRSKNLAASTTKPPSQLGICKDVADHVDKAVLAQLILPCAFFLDFSRSWNAHGRPRGN